MKNLKVEINQEHYKPIEKSFLSLVIEKIEDEDCDPRTGQLEKLQKQMYNLMVINHNLLQVLKENKTLSGEEVLEIIGYDKDSYEQVTFME